MAKVTINGRSYMITSSIGFHQLKKVAKYSPNSLKLLDPETKEENFSISISEGGKASVSQHGVIFNYADNTAEKRAAVTMLVPGEVEDVEQYVKDELAIILLRLDKVERKVKGNVLSEIEAQEKKISESISVQG